MLNIHSFYFQQSPLFSELPFKFNLSNFEKTGLDVLFYGQEHFDTMSILDDKRDISQETIGDLVKGQKILSNRQVMLKNMQKLIDNLGECEEYIQSVVDNKQVGDQQVGEMLNKCMGQFSAQDMELLEQMVMANFKDAMMTNSLSKLQTAQIDLAERINGIFSLSLNNFLLH